jgi:hypothetical protein
MVKVVYLLNMKITENYGFDLIKAINSILSTQRTILRATTQKIATSLPIAS